MQPLSEVRLIPRVTLSEPRFEDSDLVLCEHGVPVCEAPCQSCVNMVEETVARELADIEFCANSIPGHVNIKLRAGGRADLFCRVCGNVGFSDRLY